MSEEFEARAGAPQQSPQEGAEEQEKLPQEELFYWLQTLVTAIVCIVLVFTFLGRITRVVGHSMDDTLADGELLAVWSLGYEPEQGDIVVLNKTTADFLEGRGHRQAGHRPGGTDGGHRLRRGHSGGGRTGAGRALYSGGDAVALLQPHAGRPTSRCRRTPFSSWETTATAPPTAGTSGWAPLMRTISWDRRWRCCGRWAGSACCNGKIS